MMRGEKIQRRGKRESGAYIPVTELNDVMKNKIEF